MVIERVDFGIVTGREAEFELAMRGAKALLAAAPGCISVLLSRCVERPSRYMLQISWNVLADHVAFAQTPGIEEFRAVVRPFMGEKPAMEHFHPV